MSIFNIGKVLNKYYFSSHFLLITLVSFMLYEHDILKIENKMRNAFVNLFIICFFFFQHLPTVLSYLAFQIFFFFGKNSIISYWHCHFFVHYLTSHDFYFWKIYYFALLQLCFFILFGDCHHYWGNSLRRIFYYQFLQIYIVMRM